ncbi:MAG: hypothetical protein OXE96_07425 [Gemmatimonadetes bacterium]|nr:hypothetical protein [Gemmatimonadota bacterium]
MREQRFSQRSIPQWGPAAAVVMLAIAWSAPAVAQDPRPPEAAGSIPAQTLAAGQATSIDLMPYFTDPDGDALAFAATISDASIATVSVSGNILTIAGVESGMAVVTVFASDPGGLSTALRTEVTVEAPNRAPVPVGTIPGQSLAPGQWVSISLSSYFRDPEGGALRFSASTSNGDVADAAVSDDVVTITHAGPGTAIVNAVARDSDGLSVRQSIAVAGVSGQVTPAAAQPGIERSDPVQPRRAPPEPTPRRTQPGVPPVDEAGAGAQRAGEARQPDPFPPRLLVGFVGTTGYTLAQGRGHVGAGYLGASPLAQIGEFGDAWPGVGQISYGVTDDLTVTAGSGFFYYNVGGGDSDLFPYFAPRFRAWNNEQISVAVEGYAGLWLAEETVTYYAGSLAASVAVDDAIGLHASGGVIGISATVFGETLNEQFGVVALGGDVRVTPELGLTGEFRRVGIEDGTNIVTAGLRFLQTTIAGEAGLAYYLEDDAEIRPVVSVAYRF